MKTQRNEKQLIVAVKPLLVLLKMHFKKHYYFKDDALRVTKKHRHKCRCDKEGDNYRLKVKQLNNNKHD